MPIYKITRQDLADTVLERWEHQYPADSTSLYGDDKQKTKKKLRALGPNPSPDAIDEAIGNTSWTDLACDNCGQERLEEVWQVGQESDYESRTADLCATCIKRLSEMAGG